MKIRQHEPGANGVCLHCGAIPFDRVQEYYRKRGKDVPEKDERQCLPREVCPEPQRREPAYMDAATISRRIGELYEQRTEAMNHVEAAPEPEPQPDFDYGCG